MKAGYFFKHFAGTLLFFLVLFISAGRLDYWQGWIYLLISLVMFSLNYTVLRIDPGLLEERSKPGESTKKWDRMILGLSFIFTLSMHITAGLDSGRYHLSPEFHWSVCCAGIMLTVAGQLLFLIAQKQNIYFFSTVQVQNERGHTVYEKGVYRLVRHPAYLGSILQSTGFPLLLGSLWCTIPAFVLIVLFIIRTTLEDHVLMNELQGYLEYTRKTRFRIIPFVW